MAIADADYKFVSVEIGARGAEVDATVFSQWIIGKKIIDDELDIPDSVTIGNVKVPFYFVADNAFPLCDRIIKGFSSTRKKPLAPDEIAFNYRLSRARRCIENAFGILTAKWRCIRRCLECDSEKARTIVTTCVVLHNLLLKKTAKYTVHPVTLTTTSMEI